MEKAIIIAASSTVNAAAMVIEPSTKILNTVIMTHGDWLVSHMNDKVWD